VSSTRIYLISSDAAWAEHMAGLVREEGLGKTLFFPLGKGALAAYREALPDVVIFDLRQERRDITVALTMIREIFPRMAHGGVVVIGAADPADRETLRQEREQLNRIQLAEYLPRNTPEDFVVERLHALRQRAEEFQRQPRAAAPAPVPAAPEPVEVLPEPPAAPRPAPPPKPRPVPGEPVPCLVKVLLSRPDQQEALLAELADLGAEPLVVDDSRNVATLGDLPDFLIVDGAVTEAHANFLTQLRRQYPGLRIIQLPDEGDKGMRRLSRDISALLGPAAALAGGPDKVAQAIRRRVSPDDDASPTPILLLVEDEQNIRELTAHYLLLQGYEVYQAEDGMEAMTVFRARQPHLILSDVYMPRMNGFKLLLEVKNWLPDMPMLMMTGYSSATQVLNTSKYRNVTFLAKPFRLSELGERIRAMLGALS
jgi:CheY-like chemotaxis protein